MTNRGRGRLIAFFALAAFAGVTQLVFHPFRPPAPPPTPADPRVVEAEKRAACTEYADQYKANIELTTACTEDEQCAVETRTPTWIGMDECFRIVNKDTSHPNAASFARQWRLRGCSDPQVLAQGCPAAPVVHCRRAKCVERTMAALPADWKRVSIPKVGRFYLPPDLQTVTTDVKTGPQLPVYAELEGKGRTLTVQVVWRPIPPRTPPAGTPSPSVAATGAKLLAQSPVSIDVHPTTLFMIDGRPTAPLTQGKTPTKPKRFNAVAELADVTAPAVLTNLEPPGKHWLVLGMSCETRADCESLAVIAEQSELQLSRNGSNKDAGVNLNGPYIPY